MVLKNSTNFISILFSSKRFLSKARKNCAFIPFIDLVGWRWIIADKFNEKNDNKESPRDWSKNALL